MATLCNEEGPHFDLIASRTPFLFHTCQE